MKIECIGINTRLYDIRSKYCSEVKDSSFIYPFIKSMSIKDGINLQYCSKNTRGHYGVKKIIIMRCSSKVIIDSEGLYGIGNYGIGLVDTVDNLIQMKKVLESDEFKELTTKWVGGNDVSNKHILDGLNFTSKIMSEFRKDFWKEFYTDEMEQELIAEGVFVEKGELIYANIR